MDGISGMSNAQQMGQMNVKVLKQAQDMAKDQMSTMLNSLPQAANMPGMGGNIDVSA